MGYTLSSAYDRINTVAWQVAIDRIHLKKMYDLLNANSTYFRFICMKVYQANKLIEINGARESKNVRCLYYISFLIVYIYYQRVKGDT